MSFADLYTSGEHRRNLAHFAALATLASIDGEISAEEKALLDRFASKLDITKAEYEEVLKKENKYPIDSTPDSEKRLERLYDLFRIIYSDHAIDDEEMILIKKYAIGLGFTGEKADKVIERSIAIFGGKIDFEDYLYLLKH
ncbi:TerB family tellurite resistance protein [Maribacter confluentis]|uniref:Tellurite resistance protein TerB n=2 Tax=Maribacter TaxID=252356 RepID=A0ABY1SCV2_9FLAO|nr:MULTISPECIES: TerB family tellurite resistance protein [Maribacter]MDO1513241.1 TerB family tellurite resistance protein [Maribacter confluentis]TVZ16498.1 tellurite resistance protein TerB [Maribacter sp. MAR_2009_72]SNR27071.1 Tellurite resistance protein TerB [Maribacter sedimenticola]